MQGDCLNSVDRGGQSKITTGSAAANVLGDFTLTPEFIGFYSDPMIRLTEYPGE